MNRLVPAVFGLAAVVLWLGSAELTAPARVMTVFLVILLPALMLAQGEALEALRVEQISRLGAYLSSSLALWALAAVTLVAAFASGFTAESLGLGGLPAAHLTTWTAAATLGGVVVLVAGRALRVPETPFLQHLLPRSRCEKLAFVGVALTAGSCEELVFRGFLIPALTTVLGSVWPAAVLSALVFGLLHGYQGAVGIVRTGAIGFVLALPLLVTGSVWPSVLAHFVLDLIVGLWLADWLTRLAPSSA